jgi:hypothetical protein
LGERRGEIYILGVQRRIEDDTPNKVGGHVNENRLGEIEGEMPASFEHLRFRSDQS